MSEPCPLFPPKQTFVGGKLPGAFRYRAALVSEQNVLAQKRQLLVRYYLWATDGLWRLPNQLHQDLIDREVALSQSECSAVW